MVIFFQHFPDAVMSFGDYSDDMLLSRVPPGHGETGKSRLI